MLENIDQETNSTLCVICLEELDDEIMEACDICKIHCHINCLYNWYIKNSVELCPICLKQTDNNNIIKNDLFIEDENDRINRNNDRINRENNRENNRRRETNRINVENDGTSVEININNILEIHDTIEDRKNRIASYIICGVFILVLFMILFSSI